MFQRPSLELFMILYFDFVFHVIIIEFIIIILKDFQFISQ